MAAEYSIATTSQMINLAAHDWSEEILEAFGIKKSLLPTVTKPGETIGELTDELCSELGIPKAKVILCASHDTQSAVTAVPSRDKDFIFISCGTWSLFGTEVDAPIINDASKALNVTNEGGFDYTTAFLKNICGLWLIQESRRHWGRAGDSYTYADLEREALKTKPFACFIDPDAPEFTAMGDIPARVREYCARTGQYVPQTVGEIMRCIYESLALKYRYTFDGIKQCTGKAYDKIHVVGGGTKDGLLCRMTADACAVTVLGGPIEATVLGNIAVQLIASGGIRDIAQARRIIADGENLKVYEPTDIDVWEDAYKRFVPILGK